MPVVYTYNIRNLQIVCIYNNNNNKTVFGLLGKIDITMSKHHGKN